MFNNPYLYQNMYKPGILARLFGKTSTVAKGINWSSILTNTQKSLGIINQAIPLVYQVKPIVNNAKTMFKIANAVKTPDSKNNVKIENTNNIVENDNKPIFYI